MHIGENPKGGERWKSNIRQQKVRLGEATIKQMMGFVPKMRNSNLQLIHQLFADLDLDVEHHMIAKRGLTAGKWEVLLSIPKGL